MKKKFKIATDAAGFAMVMVILSGAVGLTIAIAVTNLLISQSKLTTSIMLDMNALQFSQDIGRQMRIPGVCDALLQGVNIGIDNQAILTVNKLNASPLRATIGNIQLYNRNLSIQDIQLNRTNLAEVTSPFRYEFKITIVKDRRFIVGPSVIQLRTNIMQINVNAGVIQNPACASVDGINVGGGGNICPAGQLMIGLNAFGAPVCTTPGSQVGAPCIYRGINGITSRGPGNARCCLIGFYPGSGGAKFHGGLAGGWVAGCYGF